MRKAEEYERQNCLINVDNILDKVLNKLKEVTRIENLMILRS